MRNFEGKETDRLANNFRFIYLLKWKAIDKFATNKNK